MRKKYLAKSHIIITYVTEYGNFLHSFKNEISVINFILIRFNCDSLSRIKMTVLIIKFIFYILTVCY